MADITPIAGKTHDITITDNDSISPVETGFMLYRDPNNKAPRISVSREPPLAPQIFQGLAHYSDQPPETDLPWEIRTFHKGGLSFRWSPETDGKFNEADGIDTHTPEEFSLANTVGSKLDVLIRNGGAELGATTGWTASNATHTVISTDSPRSGTYQHKMVLTNANGYIQNQLVGGTAWRGGTITAVAYIKRLSGTGSALLRIFEETAGLSTDSSSSNSTSFTKVSATVATINAGTTNIQLRVVGDTNGDQWAIDDVFVYSSDSIVRGYLEFVSNLYMAIGKVVCKWNTSTSVFECVLAYSNICTGLGISPSNDRLVAGFGTGGTNYYYHSADGSAWTAVSAAGGVSGGGPYVSIRNTIWAIRGGSTVGSSVDVVTPTWTSYTGIGTGTRSINGLFAMQDVPVIGKSDGLWVYNRVANDWSAADQFMDITPEFQYQPHTDNFARGIEWTGWLYVSSRKGIYRYNGRTLEDVTSRFSGPQLTDFGGRVRAFAADSTKAYVLMDTPSSDASATKTTWLMSFKELSGIGLIAYPIHKLSIGDLNSAYTFYDATNTYLWIGGRLFDSGSDYVPVVYRMKIPDRHESPARDVTPDLPTTAKTLITQWWDGLLPTVTKACISLNLRTDNCTANRTVKVEYMIDEDTDWTYPDSSWTLSSDGTQTLYFSAAVLAKRKIKRIRFRFTLSTNSSTASPRVLLPIVLHTSYRPLRLKHYEFTVRVGDNIRVLSGGKDNVNSTTLLSRLDGYLNAEWPSTLKEDEDGDGTITSHTVFVTNVERRTEVLDQVSRQREWLYHISASERKVTA